MREAAFIRGARNVFTGLRRWSARHERFLWTGLIVVVVAVQWPMLKGLYYRAAEAPPPQTSIQWRTNTIHTE